MLENMDLTKEQYIETCKLIDELDLMPENAKPTDPEDMDWDEILGES